jgi:hypothetical protein
MSAIEITQEQRDQIKKRQVANALTKLNAGGSLSAREQALLDEITEFDPSRRANRFSISELAILTGKDRRTITTKLEGISFEAGAKGAMLYDSVIALDRIYAIDARKISLDEAKTRHALSQAGLNAVREEDLRRQRIPIHVVRDLMDEVFQAIGATLKSAKGKKLTSERINELFDKFRALPKRLKW